MEIEFFEIWMTWNVELSRYVNCETQAVLTVFHVTKF